MRKFSAITFCLLAFSTLILFLSGPVRADVPEYDLKALFIERFTRFVEWPAESSITDTTKPFVVGVIGKNPFGTGIEKIYSALRIQNKKITIRYISRLQEIDQCYLLFISDETHQNLSQILNYTKDKPILTISDTEGYAQKGVYINFYIEKGKLRFEINQSAVKQSKLKVSYMLMQHAKIINPAKENQ